jgi:tryptophanyl-tRNA synthetase
MITKDKQGRLMEISKSVTKAKTEVLIEFEKVCPSEMSFNRIKREIHDVFDKMLEEIKFHV